MFVQVNSTLIQTDTTSFGIGVAVVFWTIWGILHKPVVFPLTNVMWKLQLWLLLKDVPSTLCVTPQHKRYISPVWRRSFFGEIFIALLNISDLLKWSSCIVFHIRYLVSKTHVLIHNGIETNSVDVIQHFIYSVIAISCCFGSSYLNKISTILYLQLRIWQYRYPYSIEC